MRSATLFARSAAARLLEPMGRGHAAGFRRFAGYSLVALVMVVGTTAAVSLRREALAEATAIARLPAPPGRCPECPVDRHGHRPRREPEALWLPPRHHASPGPVGEQRRALRAGHGTGSLDVPVALLVPDRPVALDAGRRTGSRP